MRIELFLIRQRRFFAYLILCVGIKRTCDVKTALVATSWICKWCRKCFFFDDVISTHPIVLTLFSCLPKLCRLPVVARYFIVAAFHTGSVFIKYWAMVLYCKLCFYSYPSAVFYQVPNHALWALSINDVTIALQFFHWLHRHKGSYFSGGTEAVRPEKFLNAPVYNCFMHSSYLSFGI